MVHELQRHIKNMHNNQLGKQAMKVMAVPLSFVKRIFTQVYTGL